MKRLSTALFALAFLAFTLTPPALRYDYDVDAQTRERRVGASDAPAPAKDEETVKVDVDLVVLDALVMQNKTGRVVGDLKREDFALFEDGVRQEITHFGQDTLPLSVLLLIDRGGCLDPFGEEVHRATLDAVARLKPTDEVAVMTYHNTADLLEGFTRDRARINEALDRVPPHDEQADHCLNLALNEAADYMISAGNPVGRRVIIVVTGVKSNFDCPGPSSKEARLAIFESGSVVCGLVPKTDEQRIENGVMRMATKMGGMFGAPSVSIDKLAEETGGEVMDDDKPETLDRAFNTLMDHLRTRYNMGFVSTNKAHDGHLRKLKLKLSDAAQKRDGGKLVVKTRGSYVAPKADAAQAEGHGSK
jgi:VWFA-related protein